MKLVSVFLTPKYTYFENKIIRMSIFVCCKKTNYSNAKIINMSYSAEEKQRIFDDIIKDIIEKRKSLRKALKGRISISTFFEWIKNDTEKSKQYARAMEIRADLLFDEILMIADKPKEGVVTKDTPKGIVTITGDMTEHRKLQIDARKWVVARMQPKKYGVDVDRSIYNESSEDESRAILKLPDGTEIEL